ncbi:MAG TPA: NBR1-Ig-like domain-containing protein [Candidatus Dormibacteraeota bacterium]
MAQSNAVAGFKASVNGLHFINSWPSEPDIVVNVPGLGNVGIGDASNGLCGGMVFTVRDVFQAGLPPIPDTTNPPAQSPLFNYLVSRLFASFNLPFGVLKYFDWMNTPDHDTGVWIVIRRGVAWLTIMGEWPAIKADIDSNMLSPLGLVTVYSANPGDVGKNHQVLAYGYDLDDSNQLTLRVYDPNTKPEFADQVRLVLNLSDPTHTTPIDSNVAINEGVRGFFRVPYLFADPSSLEQVPPLPSNALFDRQTVPTAILRPGQTAPMQVVMQNLGGTTWTASGPNPFRLGSQNPQDNATWGLQRVNVAGSIAPGDEATFDFEITAPTTPGTYNVQWRMVQEMVNWFGDFTPNVPLVVEPAAPPALNVTIAPYPAPTGRAFSLTVFATDAKSAAPVSGTVLFNGSPVGTTGVPFVTTIPVKRIFDPELRKWITEANPPSGTVTAPGYSPGQIDFGV